MIQRVRSERALAAATRIKIIDHIAEVDLPGFIFEQIDSSLNELNYYKLSNLYDNIKQYTEYLYVVARKYNADIKKITTYQTEKKSNQLYFQQFMTNKLLKEWWFMNLTKKQSVSLYTKYSVLCILTMKEYINRRILQASAKKQQAMSKVSHTTV